MVGDVETGQIRGGPKGDVVFRRSIIAAGHLVIKAVMNLGSRKNRGPDVAVLRFQKLFLVGIVGRIAVVELESGGLLRSGRPAIDIDGDVDRLADGDVRVAGPDQGEVRPLGNGPYLKRGEGSIQQRTELREAEGGDQNEKTEKQGAR